MDTLFFPLNHLYLAVPYNWAGWAAATKLHIWAWMWLTRRPTGLLQLIKASRMLVWCHWKHYELMMNWENIFDEWELWRQQISDKQLQFHFCVRVVQLLLQWTRKLESVSNTHCGSNTNIWYLKISNIHQALTVRFCSPVDLNKLLAPKIVSGLEFCGYKNTQFVPCIIVGLYQVHCITF